MPHVELPQAEFKLVMLGDTNAGKTSLVLRFAEGYYRDEGRSSTVGAFFITKRIQTSNGITCKVQIWDTAGQAQFRKMAPMYYKTASAAILCYDMTSRESYSVMREWLDELHRNVQGGNLVIAFAATKSDLAYEADPGTLVPPAEVEELAAKNNAIFIDTSAKSNNNVNLLFQRVSERVLLTREQARMKGLKKDNMLPVSPGIHMDEDRQMNQDGIFGSRGDSKNFNNGYNRNSSDFSRRSDDNDELRKSGSVIDLQEESKVGERPSMICSGPFMECVSSDRSDGTDICLIS
mmetsp:Transcript_841/g.1303  ORF Transcript_841/g.1303 Transcript_841/m.1303 type:complete len:292 (-) Transcript_841:105-980(-)